MKLAEISKDLQKFDADFKKLKDCVEHYADEKHYEHRMGVGGFQAEIFGDRGKKARDVQKEIK